MRWIRYTPGDSPITRMPNIYLRYRQKFGWLKGTWRWWVAHSFFEPRVVVLIESLPIAIEEGADLPPDWLEKRFWIANYFGSRFHRWVQTKVWGEPGGPWGWWGGFRDVTGINLCQKRLRNQRAAIRWVQQPLP